MNNVSTNYQLSFRALVPKAQYSGTPRLSRRVINEINKVKESIKEADKEIIDLESNLSNPEIRGIIIDYFLKRLEIFKDFREKLASEIAVMKEQRTYNHKKHYKMFKDHSDKVEKLEEKFAKASKKPDEAYLIYV